MGKTNIAWTSHLETSVKELLQQVLWGSTPKKWLLYQKSRRPLQMVKLFSPI